MTEKPTKDEPNDAQKQKKPRGMGGVVLILTMLMVLFLIVSRSGLESQNSVDALWSHLFNGRVERLLLTQDVAAAEIKLPDGRTRTMEVVLGDMMRPNIDLLHRLATLKLDTTEYPPSAGDALGSFLGDAEAQKARVLEAWFVHESPGKVQVERPREENTEVRTAGGYLTALFVKDNRTIYARFDPSGPTSLQSALHRLQAVGAKVNDWQLTLGAAEFRISEPNTALLYVLTTVGPWLLILAIVWFFILRQMRSPGGSGGVLSFGRSRAALYTKENRTNITFDDVAGMDEAKAEVREIIEFLKNPQKFARLGGSIPRGVLLVGSPGTGKTLLAKAIAGEAEVPFFSISGSDFVEMFVGVGASRVRDLFKQAREASPCIVFLDEIDAVGRKRGTGMGGGHDEREQTLNAILVEMDGFDSDKGIILVGATNRPDVLDPALLRPGRFDRQVTIDLPDVKGREAILKVHARKVRVAPNVDVVRIAKATPGFSGAELAAVINEAAILAAMKNEDAVDMLDLEEARDRVRWGREKKSRAIEEADRKVTAYHEAGHAIVSIMTPDQDPVHKVTIVSRGRALGATLSLPEKDDYNHWRKKLLGRIAVCFGGRCAEEIVFGDMSAGAQNDIEQATNLARVMVCELGMSPKVGPIKYTTDDQNPFLGREFQLSSGLSQKTLDLVDEEVRRLITEQYDAARGLLVQHRSQLDRLAESLLKHETLTGDEIGALLRGDSIEDYRAAQTRKFAAAEAARAAAAATTAAATPAPKPAEPGVGLSGA